MVASLSDSDELQLNAYCDGELDPVSANEFERRLANDESLKARHARLLSLRRAMRSLPQADMPSSLQARIQSKLDAERPSNVTALRRRSWSFQALAAAAVFGAVISSAFMMTIEQYDQRENVASQVVAGHIRSLLAPQPFDIASSDRHTVKPWFNGKVDFAPPVVDLATQGYPLVGGRLDRVDGRRAAALVFRRRAHTINLFIWPGAAAPAPQLERRQGYSLVRWGQGGLVFWAVSDVDPADLAGFQKAFAAATAG